jgi:hypothetical protein
MPLTNAEKQKRWRTRQRRLANAGKEALRLQEAGGQCIFCLMDRKDLEEDGHIVAQVGNGRVIFCDECIEKAAASIARTKLRAVIAA